MLLSAPFLVAALMSAAAQASGPAVEARPTDAATVFATVGHSEWCPAGSVYLNLRNGRYSLTVPAPRAECDGPDLERQVEEGTLPADRLAAVRLAHEAAQAAGVTEPACRNGGRPPSIVISNGGRAAMVLSGPRETLIAPEEQGCWTAAANRLHRLMEDIFTPQRRPR